MKVNHYYDGVVELIWYFHMTRENSLFKIQKEN